MSSLFGKPDGRPYEPTEWSCSGEYFKFIEQEGARWVKQQKREQEEAKRQKGAFASEEEPPNPEGVEE